MYARRCFISLCCSQSGASTATPRTSGADLDPHAAGILVRAQSPRAFSGAFEEDANVKEYALPLRLDMTRV